LIVAALVAALPVGISAHHGSVVNPDLYLAENLMELEGEIAEVLWRNPHVRYKLEVSGSGEEAIWELELNDNPISFARMGILPDDFIQVGDRVLAAGYLSKRNANLLGVLHLLLPNGQEFVIGDREPRWDNRMARDTVPLDPVKVEEARRSASGIFRVWGRRLGQPLDASILMDWLTERGLELASQYDPLTDNLELECEQGMPDTMFDPVPVEITNHGDYVQIHVQEYNVERMIPIVSEAASTDLEPTALGYSYGRWDGDVLEVTTTGVDWPYYGELGAPQSTQASYTERFSVSDGGNVLNYSITIRDPSIFASPFTIERTREWVPGIEIEPYDCVVEWE